MWITAKHIRTLQTPDGKKMEVTSFEGDTIPTPDFIATKKKEIFGSGHHLRTNGNKIYLRKI
jgi:hypothetical protein